VLTDTEWGLLRLALDPGAAAGESRNAWALLYRLLRERKATGYEVVTGAATRVAAQGSTPRRASSPFANIGDWLRVRYIYEALYRAGERGLTRTELRSKVWAGTMTPRAEMDRAFTLLLTYGKVRKEMRRSVSGPHTEWWYAIAGEPPDYNDWDAWLLKR
jgi:hypothetical protein